eukprot:CAMPEP_0198347292 /NCGR_PEP_ID=MMETSP1450-20131203/84050_1 /TAXON_ID=753684 ORGANISM="Madagascaria erythrocladiodes, Strain CCMP3234" /NCGR_SAMPLE_ID=MMETSP1450 /ASSEMBLY_ACC=CAM_ASM_001115 /LENGTH=65 /DNA_ID=CAMNT_0044052797 /DNA_START=45 /DNA_END=238 /DNA_ORIENTATION=-
MNSQAYIKMLKVGSPEAVVRNKMKVVDGLSDGDIDEFFRAYHAGTAATTTTATTTTTTTMTTTTT